MMASVWLSLTFRTRGPRLPREGEREGEREEAQCTRIDTCTHGLKLFNSHLYPSHHFTARFCTSPFLSSTSFNTPWTTLRSLSSSSLIESFCSSVIRSLVAMNRKSLSTEFIWGGKRGGGWGMGEGGREGGREGGSEGGRGDTLSKLNTV